MKNDGNSGYDVVTVFWKSANFNLLIVKYPENKAAAKFKSLGAVRTISKLEYYNFVLASCLVDMDRVTAYLAKTNPNLVSTNGTNLVDELVEHVIEINPSFNPNLLVVDKDGFIVPSSKTETSTTLLTKNPSWGMSWEDLLDDIDQKFLEGMGIPTDDAPDNVEMCLWEEAGLEVPILKLDNSLKALKTYFSARNKFLNEMGYKAYVAQNSIYEFTALTFKLEELGFTQEMSPIVLLDALFNLVVEVNPHLSVENSNPAVVTISSSSTNKPTRRNKKTIKPGKSGASAAAGTELDTEARTSKDFTSVTPKELLSLERRVNAKVIGQRPSVKAICETIQVAGAGLRSTEKPLATFLLTGETGTGKTYLAKVLAKELAGETSNIIRVDCSEYGHAHEVSKLIGAPPGYVGHDTGGFLTNKVSKNPFSVVLFDEVEKAHSKLFDILLQILDEGRLTDGKGVTVDFSDCVVLLTSNIGTSNVSKIKKTVGFGDVGKITHSRKKAAIKEAITKKFKPEFINRLDGILTFNSLGERECRTILNLTFKEVSGYLKERGVRLSPSKEAKDLLIRKGFSAEYGARALKRTLESLVIKPLALRLLKEGALKNCEVVVNSKDDEMSFEIIKDPEKPESKVEVEVTEIFRS